MFSFLQRDLPASGRVLYPGAIPPPLPQLAARLNSVSLTPFTPSDVDCVWAAKGFHRDWGEAEIVCLRKPAVPSSVFVDHTLTLTDEEKVRARSGEATIGLSVRAQQRQVLTDRKRLLFWLRALLQADGAVAIDDASMIYWSETMLDDELAHDADLDIESLYCIHAVQNAQDSDRVDWLHTHGLGELRALDVDILQPSPEFVANCGDPIRALAFAALEGRIGPDVDRFPLAYPGGDVRLVSVERFHADAAPEHRNLRELDEFHTWRRAVVCEPVGGLFSRWRSRPVPSRFLSRSLENGSVLSFSKVATALMSARARQTVSVFRTLSEEFDSLELPALVKLGYEVEGGAEGDQEHLWFAVHRVLGDTVDATLTNEPHRVPALKAGQRAEWPLERLTDWVILSPEGPMTPRNISAARRLRVDRATWQARLDAAKQAGEPHD
jgi:hypothetical protein